MYFFIILEFWTPLVFRLRLCAFLWISIICFGLRFGHLLFRYGLRLMIHMWICYIRMSTLLLYSFKISFACRDLNVHGVECFEGEA